MKKHGCPDERNSGDCSVNRIDRISENDDRGAGIAANADTPLSPYKKMLYCILIIRRRLRTLKDSGSGERRGRDTV